MKSVRKAGHPDNALRMNFQHYPSEIYAKAKWSLKSGFMLDREY
jgi:hypothetical protein